MLNKNFLTVMVGILYALALTSCGSGNNGEKGSGDPDSMSGLARVTQQIIADSNNADLYFKRAELYIQEKKIDPAFRDLNRAITLNPEDARFFVALSDIYLMQGKIASCKESLEKAISLDVNNKDAYLKLAELNLMLKNYEETFENLKKAIEIDALNPVAYFISAYAFLELEDTARAIENFQKAADQDQHYYDAYIYLGNIFAARKQKLAVDYYNNALNIDPQSIEAHYNLALFYQETEQIDEAEALYDRLLKIDPGYIYALYNLGYINLVYKKDFERAVQYFTETIGQDQDYYEAYYNRGYAYELMGNYNEARWDYQKTLELRTNYPRAIEGLNRLDGIQLR
ncbi:MAG: tetratricopeptide repeat protein [Bacteroides sp.]|jgi:tetratricopeptide (TPR) repeat protein|nr:tetratricopeptide repeat protein [Bacteroides sp.]